MLRGRRFRYRTSCAQEAETARKLSFSNALFAIRRVIHAQHIAGSALNAMKKFASIVASTMVYALSAVTCARDALNCSQ